MNSLPVAAYTASQVREMDRAAIEDHGIAGYELMCRAAGYAFEFCRLRYPDADSLTVLCGAGNNAGDAYVFARLAREHGLNVTTVAVSDSDRLGGDAARAFSDYRDAGGGLEDWSPALTRNCDLIVDGLLGTGLQRAVSGRYAEVIAAVNDSGTDVLALDLPSGLHADSGNICGIAIRAAATVTFVGLKTGLLLADGPDYAGHLEFTDLGIPPEIAANTAVTLERIDDDFARRSLPTRPRDAHKGLSGHLLAIGGGPGMPGAVHLCGEAALRAGAGLVSIATHPQNADAVAIERPELMPHGVGDSSALSSLVQRADVIAVGPGLGQDDWAKQMLQAAMTSGRLLVLDADALNLLAADNALASQLPETAVLTPHPGEAARLLGIDTAAIQADRLAALRQLLQRYRATVVLKGAGTLIGAATAPPAICTAGNPGMAVAGMGDVLTGIIGAFLAQGLDSVNAARAGVLVHAQAGDRAAASGQRGLIASDLIGEIRACVNP